MSGPVRAGRRYVSVIDNFGAAEQTRGYNLDADSVTG